MTPQEWLEAYKTAWETKDAEAAVRIFSADASYREVPYDEPFLGREGIRAYWTKVTALQENIRFRYGRVVSQGSHAAVEWWVTMVNDGAEMTLAGEFFLRFDADGLVEDLREYWHYHEGIVEPPAGWGQ